MQSIADDIQHRISHTKGCYILIINLPEDITATIGRLPTRHFSSGYYAYVGSAMRGFKARLDHHLRENKRPHWHIDYLLQRASITSIILCETEYKFECDIAQALQHQFDSVPNFGSSDCRCGSHLFSCNSEEKLKSTIVAVTEGLGLQPRLLEQTSHRL